MTVSAGGSSNRSQECGHLSALLRAAVKAVTAALPSPATWPSRCRVGYHVFHGGRLFGRQSIRVRSYLHAIATATARQVAADTDGLLPALVSRAAAEEP
jgi:hypothetical protein